MHAVSSGLVLLAHFPPAEIDRFLEGPLERFTSRTVTDPGAVRERIRRAQRDGHAWTRDEYAEGITSVAAAIANEEGEVVAAVHVHGPSYRFPEPGSEAAVAERVVLAAARVAANLRQASAGALRGPAW
jgi:DNA-binding IclR family transcriptional regulator